MEDGTKVPLSDDIWLSICIQVDFRSLPSLSQVCRSLHRILRSGRFCRLYLARIAPDLVLSTEKSLLAQLRRLPTWFLERQARLWADRLLSASYGAYLEFLFAESEMHDIFTPGEPVTAPNYIEHGSLRPRGFARSFIYRHDLFTFLFDFLECERSWIRLVWHADGSCESHDRDALLP